MIWEDIIVEVQQIWDHIIGNASKPSHLIRKCVICQPSGPMIRKPKPVQSLLPGNYPSDLDYMSLKNGGHQIPKRLLLFLDPSSLSFPSQHPGFKEWMFFLGTLSYDVEPKLLPTSKLIIFYFSSNIQEITNQITLAKRTCIICDKHLMNEIIEMELCVSANLFIMGVESMNQLRHLHLILLQKIGRCSIQQIIYYCQTQSISYYITNLQFTEASFIY